MFPLLAQTTLDVQAGIWIAGAVGALGALNQGARFLDRFRENPPTHEKYATIDQLRAVNTRIDTLDGKISESFRRNGEAGERRSAAIYARMNENSTSLAEMRGEMKGVTDAIHAVQQKLDAITPEIALQARQLSKDVGRLEGVVQRGEKLAHN